MPTRKTPPSDRGAGPGVRGGRRRVGAGAEDRQRRAADQHRRDPLERLRLRDEQQRGARGPAGDRGDARAARPRAAAPAQLRPRARHGADAAEDERDRVGHVRLHGAEAGGQQRRVADQRGEPGHAPRQARADPGADQQEQLGDAQAGTSRPSCAQRRWNVALTVDPLVGVRAEEVALALDQRRGPAGAAVAVVVREARRERRHRDAELDRLGDHAPPRLLRLLPSPP